MYLSNLGSALRTRFERTGRLADLDQAIQAAQNAIAATPTDHPYRAGYLSNLGSALQARFERTGRLADLDQAIQAAQDAIAATPTDHPDRAAMLSNLGVALQTRFERTGGLVDLDHAQVAYTAALEHPTAAALLRARAGRTAATIAADTGDWATAHTHLGTVIDLLPTLTDHALSPQDRQHHLRQLQGLAPDAAHAAVAALVHDRDSADRTATAWRHLEQARTVLLTQALHTRTSADDLHHTRPDLADELDQVRRVLTTGDSSSDEHT
jgi:tetratricopeptide (TPR) repeat protein